MRYYFTNRFIQLENNEAIDGTKSVESDEFGIKVNYETSTSQVNNVDFLVVDEDKLNSRDLFLIGYFANRVGIEKIKSRLIFIGTDKRCRKNIISMISSNFNYHNLKYRVFDCNNLSAKDIIFIGMLSNNNRTVIGYGDEDSSNMTFIKHAFYAIFSPEKLKDELGSDKDRNTLGDYELDVNDYNSFRKIPYEIMMELSKNKI